MRKFDVKVEINGDQALVGNIICDDTGDARFAYAGEYLQHRDAAPISISLPLQEEPFSEQQTRNFFDGLLPEGFTRKAVAGWMHADADDYMTLLGGLGRECLGAIQILDGISQADGRYEKLSLERVQELANEGTVCSAQLVAKSRLSLTGASGKAGLYYDADSREWYLPIGSAPSTHIVKQSHVRLGGIVTNEQLSLMTAAGLGIDIPESFIINTGAGEDRDVLFAVRRYDRTFAGADRMLNGILCPRRLHQEDFAQAMGIASAGKYEKDGDGYLGRMFEILRRYSAEPIADQIKLWRIILFDYLIGNTDNHIKNISLLYSADLRKIRLAPAYDIVSTAVYEESTRNMAFAVGGKTSLDEITEESFREAAGEAGLGQKMAMNCLEEMCSQFEAKLKEASWCLAQQGYPRAYELRERILQKGGIRSIQRGAAGNGVQ